LGQEKNLLCEFQDTQNNQEGGYLESSRLRQFFNLMNAADDADNIRLIDSDESEDIKKFKELAEKKNEEELAHAHHHH